MDDDDEAVIASSCLIFGASIFIYLFIFIYLYLCILFIFIYLFIYISNVIGCRASLTEKVGRVVSFSNFHYSDTTRLSPTSPPTRQTILTCRDGPTRPTSQ